MQLKRALEEKGSYAPEMDELSLAFMRWVRTFMFIVEGVEGGEEVVGTVVVVVVDGEDGGGLVLNK